MSYQLKDELKLSPSASQFVTSIAFFPWSIKPLYGYGSICVSHVIVVWFEDANSVSHLKKKKGSVGCVSEVLFTAPTYISKHLILY